MGLAFYLVELLRVSRPLCGLVDVHCMVYSSYSLTSLNAHLSCSTFLSTTANLRHGTGMKTGIDLEALVDAGDYACRILKRDNQSKAARAILAKREQEQPPLVSSK
jgi:hypothetical protein